MHGAQDGQKFIALMLFMPFFGTNHLTTHTGVPFSLILTVSAVMSLGTLAGGGRIVNSLGADMVELDKRQGFISDISSAFCIFLFSLFGVPISTGNVKAASVIATGVADKKRVNKKTAACLAAVSIVTFPVCFALGYFLTDLFINIGF